MNKVQVMVVTVTGIILKHIGRASGETWEVVKVSADKFLDTLKNAMNNIHSKFG